MRARNQNDTSDFAVRLLQLGKDMLRQIPENFWIRIQSKKSLLENVFQNRFNKNWLVNRAILCPLNIDVDWVNEHILQQMPGIEKCYFSIDQLTDSTQSVHFPIEFLNSQNSPRFSQHVLKLKVGAPVILLRNLNPPRLCNGTRLIVERLSDKVIQCEIITGPCRGEKVLILKIKLITADMPFEFKRIQFPIKFAFAMTINKSQGQTFDTVGVCLENRVFSRGQLYCSL